MAKTAKIIRMRPNNEGRWDNDKFFKKPADKKEFKPIDFDKMVEKASVDYSKVKSNKEKRELTLQMLLRLIPLAEAVYKSRPTQSTAYSLTNLINKVQEMMNEIEGSMDFDILSQDVFNEVISPFLGDMLKDMGRSIKRMREDMATHLKEKPRLRRKIENDVKTMYRSYASAVDARMKKLKEDMAEYLRGYGA